MKKILFYPLTCNPPHFGHVSAIKVALDNLDFDEIWIMPSGKRVDKEISTSYEDIRNLGSLFVEYLQAETHIPVKAITAALDDIDSKYTHEVIMELKSQSENEIFQLCGIDGYTSIKERVIGPDEKFVIIKRSGYELPEDLTSRSNLFILDEGIQGISSTQIREMVKVGDEEYRKLVPETIASYIEEKGLYL
jgi:nicotinate (nicotinamide) nucleotide adenylyltransferase